MGESIRVLHVDDEPDFADMVGTFLERVDAHFDIVSVTNAADGMDLLTGDDANFHCVVSDYDMPETNGIEFLKSIRKQDVAIPFILYTGKGSEEVASDAISNGADDYLQKGSGTEQYELLANRIRNAVEQYHSQQRTATLERVRGLVRDINQTLVRATSQQEIETRVCDILTEADPYKFAVIADVDPKTERVTPKTWAGTGEEFLAKFEMHVAEDTPGRRAPGGRAYHDREIAIAQNIQTDPTYEEWRDLALSHGFRSVAVVPLDYEGTFYGLLALLADRPNAFDDTEQSVLAELGADIAHAMYAQSVRLELRQNERRYQAVFNDPNILVGLIDTDGTVQDINETAMAYIDATPEQVTGLPFWETQWFEQSEAVQADIRECIDRATNGAYVEFEIDLERSDRDRYALEGFFRPVRDVDGDVVSVIVSAREVTDRKVHEQQLAQQNDRLEEIYGRISDAFFALDEEWEFTYLNEQAHDVINPEGLELEEKNIWEEFPAATERKFKPKYEQAMYDQETVSFEEYYPEPLNAWFEVRAYPSETGLSVYFRDVTDRKERERQLEQTEARFKALAENFPNGGVHYFDADLRYQYVAGAGFEPLDTTPEDLEGKTIYEVERYSAEIVDPLETLMHSTLAGNEEALEVTFENHIFDLRSVPIRDGSGAVIGGFFITQDITDQRRRQRDLERQNDQLEQFARIVSHDLRNPLNVAQGRLQLAIEECDSEHLDSMEDALDRSQALIDDLLTLSREGKDVADVESVNFGALAEDCWQTVETAEATISVESDQTIRADRSRLQQLLENLYRNAVEHGGSGVTVRVGDLENGFYVADNGPGIPDGDREQVFEPGYTTGTDGTGYGLQIVKKISTAHGWDVHVTESDEGGAQFEITGVGVVDG